MQVFDVSEIREEVYKGFQYFDLLEITADKFALETADGRMLDLIGESQNTNKLKCGILCCIKVDEKKRFRAQKTKVLYAGEIIQQGVFQREGYQSEEAADNLEYMNAIRELETKAREYEWSMPAKDPLGYTPHNFVVIEKNAESMPVIKWLTIEHVYGVNEPFSGRAESEKSLEELWQEIEQTETGEFDLDRILRRYNGCERPEHFTKVHMEGLISYTLYGGERKTQPINDVYESYEGFMQMLQELENKIKELNLKSRWKHLAGLDIEKMDELAALIAVEIYFAYGYKGIFGYAKEAGRGRIPEDTIEYLHKAENFEEYISALTYGLEENFVKKVRDVYLDLKDNNKQKPLEVLHKHIQPHLNGRYEVGKVYFAEVVEESLEQEGAKMDGLVRLFDEASHWKFIENILYGKYVFMDAMYRDYSFRIQAEYGSGPSWFGNAVLDAYLKDNIFYNEDHYRPHGWKDEIIPVRLVGYKENNMPIVEYAEGWHEM